MESDQTIRFHLKYMSGEPFNEDPPIEIYLSEILDKEKFRTFLYEIFNNMMKEITIPDLDSDAETDRYSYDYVEGAITANDLHSILIEYCKYNILYREEVVIGLFQPKLNYKKIYNNICNGETDIDLTIISSSNEILYYFELFHLNPKSYFLDECPEYIRNDKNMALLVIKNWSLCSNYGRGSRMKKIIYKDKHLTILDKFFSDRDFMFEVLNINANYIEFVVEKYKDDYEIFFHAAKNSRLQERYISNLYGCFPKKLLDNFEFMLKLIEIDPNALDFASNKLKNNYKIIHTAIKQKGSLIYTINLSAELKMNREIVLAAVTENEAVFNDISIFDKFKSDREIILAAVRKNGSILEIASKNLQSDPEIVHSAIKNNPKAFKYANKKLRYNYGFVLEAVTNNPKVLSYLPEKFRENYKIVMIAVNYDGDLIEFASEKLKNQRNIVLVAVTNKGKSLSLVNVKLQDNFIIVFAAVSNNGQALENASVRLRNNYQIVSAAVSNNGDALKSASLKLRDNYNIVFTAYNDSPNAFEYASDRLKIDRSLILLLINKYSIKSIDRIWCKLSQKVEKKLMEYRNDAECIYAHTLFCQNDRKYFLFHKKKRFYEMMKD
jgi:hypothetical protein